MAITFSCPGCRKVLKVADTMAGRRGKCPFCMEIVEVPAEAAVLEQVITPVGEEQPNAEAAAQEAPSQEQQEQEEQQEEQQEEDDDQEPAQRDPIKDTLEVFNMLSEETRFAIFRELASGPKNVGALCESIRLPQPTVSHHLALMRAIRLVERRRQGKEQVYTLDRDKIRQAADLLQQFLRP